MLPTLVFGLLWAFGKLTFWQAFFCWLAFWWVCEAVGNFRKRWRAARRRVEAEVAAAPIDVEFKVVP